MSAVRSPRPRLSPVAWAAAAALSAALDGAAVEAGDAKTSPATLASDWKAAVEADDDASFARVERDYEAQRDETVRGLLVTSVCEAARSDAAFARLKRWREKNVGADDAWLWHRSMLREYERAPATVRAELEAGAVDPGRSDPVKAAVIHALADWADPETLTLLRDAVRHGPVAPTATRDLVLEAWAHVIGSQPGRVKTKEFRVAVEALLAALERFQTSSPTRLAAARWLARAFEVEEPSTDLLTWKSLLERVDVGSDRAAARTVPASASFFDLDAHGDRVVYVLDASTSMDDPLDAAALGAFRRLTPHSRLPASAPKPDWDDVKTARQAVAEATKMSLRGLAPHAHFCVVLFGSEARLLPNTRSLVPATASNVAAACADLDSFKRNRLRGTTNLHGGLRLAFSVAVPGDPKVGRLPDGSSLAFEGATSIFLLSDGNPSRDNWDDTANMFTGRPLFADAQPIVDDVARMNLLRRCEIGTVSLGTTAQALLERLARVTGGRARVIGGAPTRSAAAPVPAIASTAAADRAAVPTLIARLAEPDDAAATSAETSLSTLAHRSFGSPLGLSKAQRAALARNWSWWFESR